ncbi:DUF2057 family protein [Solimonas soli]|uniref:DUF2057 family protein n=1 Tax=Solimonas soli TaxID=413479 RepID=UPI00146F9F68|nr:DUF2057 family protein [Solimonas soli]
MLSRILAAAAALGLAACAAPNVRLYEGPARPAADVAVITMPEQLEVATINGAEVPAAKGMWNRGDKRLELLAGRYEALIYYREVWQASGEGDVLRSKSPALFTIDAQAGHQYRIDYPRPGTYDDAKKLAQDFHGWVEDVQTGQRFASIDSGLQFRGGVVAQVTGDTTLVPREKGDSTQATTTAVQPLPPVAASAGVAGATAVAAPPAVAPAPMAPPAAKATPVAPATTATDRDWVNLMKGWWQQASGDERRAFLRWVGEANDKAAPGAGNDWLSTIKGWWARAGDADRREFLRWVGERS